MREKKELNIQIGERIRAAREQAKLTQEQLAEYTEVSTQYISDLERGVVGVSVPTLRRLCTSLGISSDYILFGESSYSVVCPLSEKCRVLSREQTVLLSGIIANFIKAHEFDRKNNDSTKD